MLQSDSLVDALETLLRTLLYHFFRFEMNPIFSSQTNNQNKTMKKTGMELEWKLTPFYTFPTFTKRDF